MKIYNEELVWLGTFYGIYANKIKKLEWKYKRDLICFHLPLPLFRREPFHLSLS